MTEQNREENIIIGEITETPSSDAYNQRRLDSIRREVLGVNSQTIDLSTDDLLPPTSVTSAQRNQLQSVSEERAVNIDPLSKSVIIEFKKRQAKLKKAA